MCGWSFTIIIIFLSGIILLVLKDLLANFIITCTLKDRQSAWLYLVEGNLASFHDQVSIKIEHTNARE
jgi:multisubunit Na+/H+ antiporter MnhC subunit